MLGAIKEVPAFTKAIKEAYIIHLFGHLSDLMLKKLAIPRYSNSGSPVVIINIEEVQVYNALVDLAASITVMIKEVMSKLHIIGLKEVPTIL